MTMVVPFDGSELAEAALVRAVEFGNALEEDVLAVSVIPKGNTKYARERGWLAQGEEFDMQDIISTLHDKVTDLCPSADFRHKIVDRYASSGSIANRLRKVAKEEDASMVFIGSDNAGRFAMTLSSVGGSVATDPSYDVVIVRQRSPAKIAKLRHASPHEKSEFYLPE